jgi:hypothetical protein
MKVISYISKVILVIFSLLLISVSIVTLTNNEENVKICRNKIEFEIKNYQNINHINEIKLLDNCDKVSLYIYLSETIDKENVNSVILNIIGLKKVYNDEIILELFIENKNFSCLVLIDENESFDIDFA